MVCGVHGGDVLAFHRQRYRLGFVEAAKQLGPGGAAMSETAREAARRLARSMLEKGYRPEALHEYTDRYGSPLYHRAPPQTSRYRR